MPVPLVSEADALGFLRAQVREGNWFKADGRTHEGRAQFEALRYGWIEGGGDGTYRLTSSGALALEWFVAA